MGAEHADEEIALEDGPRLSRIPYFPLPWDPLEAPCGACGVSPGVLHRRGCEREMCPSCGDRLGAVAPCSERPMPVVQSPGPGEEPPEALTSDL